MPTTRSTAKSDEGTPKKVRSVKNMTVEERDIAIAMLREGRSNAEVAAHFNRDPATIRKLRKKYSSTNSTKDKPRSGRPKLLSRQQEKLLYRAARRSGPKVTHKELTEAATVVQSDGTALKLPSKNTLYRALRSRNLVPSRSKK
ncbi:hypothetical protein COCMIDRAFT_3128 [Bipolaris oryzae ATCC 44560]|uniref:Transposase IS30-like HTH domain-containing protein n=1 Tax=Bipolaris oryzae ATCC 44560 TaxID=930090 RepID=W6Z8D0_COCMI|nr:uncharacterized protein COCMIDRAFT_3128 [Bipolaris oryzae ATCC 44560]EUC47997.1 hypothetical protein COCMIDRAFT_3128 [Bipolaris oryzae ATCC 44560]